MYPQPRCEREHASSRTVWCPKRASVFPHAIFILDLTSLVLCRLKPVLHEACKYRDLFPNLCHPPPAFLWWWLGVVNQRGQYVAPLQPEAPAPWCCWLAFGLVPSLCVVRLDCDSADSALSALPGDGCRHLYPPHPFILLPYCAVLLQLGFFFFFFWLLMVRPKM